MSGMRVALVFLLGLTLVEKGNGLPPLGVPFSHAQALDLSGRRVQQGIASWYGREEDGQRTANGELFDPHALTAASRHLPYNTIVRVTNEANGRSVQVRINDRGPFTHHRILDLSEAAADILDMKKSGTARVKIEVVSPPSAEAFNLP